MAEVSEEEIVKIHTTVVKRFGISDGIINKGNLSSLAARPNIVVNGNEVFPDVYTKAASLLEGIIRWHPFADGNKRTGIIYNDVLFEIGGICSRTATECDPLYHKNCKRQEHGSKTSPGGLKNIPEKQKMSSGQN